MITKSVRADVQAALLAEIAHAREPTALLVDGPTDLDASAEPHARAPHGLGGVDRGGDARLHVAGAASVDAAVAHEAAKRIHGPALSRRDDVEVPVEMYEQAAARGRARRPTTFTRGCERVCSGRPAGAT